MATASSAHARYGLISTVERREATEYVDIHAHGYLRIQKPQRKSSIAIM